MKTPKLFSRFTTLFLLLLFGFAIGAKSAGLDTLRFTVFLTALGIVAFVHYKMMRRRFS
ncbi:MAG: hypothetical protein M0P91_05900 [Sulfuricurvum sp.]|uniref:hypothetical protein n=1 Tax=Sulfuricurvum sp. TaxID=2025608 RepID=UPI0025F32172|nr:hypothetical protein [Sulfuricurvum sp.]MCK9372712.1 hypothetical protein [Sulfuricurvum sp.]